MRVTVVTADYPPDVWSGVGVAVHRQAGDLAALGVRVTVLATGQPSPEDAGSNPAVIRIATDGSIPAIQTDWVHLHSLALTELALELRRQSGARLAYTVHTQPWLELDGHPRRRFWLDMQARLLAACDAVIFLSAAERRCGETMFATLPPVHVVPHGVPPPPADVPGRDERRTVVFAGRSSRSKGVRLLAECIRRLRHMSDLPFLIAAGHGDTEGSATIARIGRDHGDRCEIAGWLPRHELDERLARALLVLVPSRYEPFGLVALEAMRMGAPVLAANVGGLRETLRAGSGGVLLDSSDPQDWAEATLRITGDPLLWTTLHQQGRRFVESQYRSCDMAARLLNDVYRSRAGRAASEARLRRGEAPPVRLTAPPGTPPGPGSPS
jgi:glycosyltransferase involved in cell wall biosynthesis